MTRLRVGQAFHVRPAYVPTRHHVPVTVGYWPLPAGSLSWRDMRPEEPEVVMQLADWLVLAGIAASVALSSSGV